MEMFSSEKWDRKEKREENPMLRHYFIWFSTNLMLCNNCRLYMSHKIAETVCGIFLLNAVWFQMIKHSDDEKTEAMKMFCKLQWHRDCAILSYPILIYPPCYLEADLVFWLEVDWLPNISNQQTFSVIFLLWLCFWLLHNAFKTPGYGSHATLAQNVPPWCSPTASVPHCF